MKYDAKLMGFISVFENFTNITVRDCFIENSGELTFIVDDVLLGKAIGKNGENVKKLSFKIKYSIKIIGFNPDPVLFVKNILYPLKGYEISKEEDKIMIKTEDTRLKGKIYGRDRSNLKWVNSIVNRFFKNLEVKIE